MISGTHRLQRGQLEMLGVVAVLVALVVGSGLLLSRPGSVAAAACGPAGSPDPSAMPSHSAMPSGPAPSGPAPSSQPQPQCEAPLDPDGTDRASATVALGEYVTTDGDGHGTTVADPVETYVFPSTSGLVSIEETAVAAAAPAGYVAIGQQVNVTAPDGGPPTPQAIQLYFYLDPSVVASVGADVVRVARDGAILSLCDNTTLQASPDPCMSADTVFGDGSLALGVYTNQAGSWLFVAPIPPDTASGTVGPGATVTTDPEADGATPRDPVETSIVASVAGTVSISESAPASPAPGGYSFVGQEVAITAPPGTVASPLQISFTVDASVLGGQDQTTLQVFRDGQPIAECTSTNGSATPDPCVSGRATSGDDVVITVLTSHASTWNIGIHNAFAFSGFFQPVDNVGADPAHPVFNSVNSGSTVPVKFGLAGNQGLLILAAGYPASRKIVCSTGAVIDPIEETTNAVGGGLKYDAATGRYQYNWKTDKSWAGTCRQLIVKLVDGSVHSANFKLPK